MSSDNNNKKQEDQEAESREGLRARAEIDFDAESPEKTAEDFAEDMRLDFGDSSDASGAADSGNADEEEAAEFEEDEIDEVLDFFQEQVEEIKAEKKDSTNEDDFVPKLKISKPKSDKPRIIEGAKQPVINKQFVSDYTPDEIGLGTIGSPEELRLKLADVGYHCLPFLAAQLSLLLNTPHDNIRSILLEGPSGCGKSYMAKSLAKITGAELMCLTCYPKMPLDSLIEAPSSFALANAMAGKTVEEDALMNLGILSRAFLKSQEKPVILLVDELDKVEVGIDTFFLGPLQDARIWLESRGHIDANVDNLLIIFTKNMERKLNDALLRRVHPVEMTYLEAELEQKILEPYCWPRLVSNLVTLADTMRYSSASYKFERPPAPEELLKVGRYCMQLLEWDIVDYTFVGRNLWYMLSKSENDRFVLELLLRYHPDYYDSLRPNGRALTKDEVYAKLGRVVLKGVVEDPEDDARSASYKVEQVGLTKVGTPNQLVRKLEEVGYECLPFLAVQMCLLLNTKFDRARGVLLEGPSGCGKSFMAKCLAKITGAEFMVLSCYDGMNTQHLIEMPSTLGLANAMANVDGNAGGRDAMVNLGILSRAYLKSQNQPVILLIDEIDKCEIGIDTFFLGPIQDGTIYPESRPPIDANIDNLLLVFTKNFVRNLNDALLRRLHPVQMTYLNAELERKILKEYCSPQLIDNIVSIVDRMRYSGGSYGFDRPPAPEELRTIGQYINLMLEWEQTDFVELGRSIWAIFSKSDHDRAVLEHMMRFHPDYLDPLLPDGRNMSMDQVYAKLGRIVLKGIVEDPEELDRKDAWEQMEYNY
jgi:MoxR-like ATPase